MRSQSFKVKLNLCQTQKMTFDEFIFFLRYHIESQILYEKIVNNDIRSL